MDVPRCGPWRCSTGRDRGRLVECFLLVFLIFLGNGCQSYRVEPLCSTPVAYDDPIVGRWLVTGMAMEFGGLMIEPSLGIKIGNHWEFSSEGRVRREPGQDGDYRIIRPGVYVQCLRGGTTNGENHFVIEDRVLEIRSIVPGPDVILELESVDERIGQPQTGATSAMTSKAPGG